MATQPTQLGVKKKPMFNPLPELMANPVQQTPILSRGLFDATNPPYMPTQPTPKARGARMGTDRAGQPVFADPSINRAGQQVKPIGGSVLDGITKPIGNAFNNLTKSEPPQLGQQQTAPVTPIASGQPAVAPPAPMPSDKELLAMANVSDTGIPFQQDTTGKVNITNPDGSGYGTIDAGSPEKNAAFAARLQDGKGAMYKGGGLPSARPEQQTQALPQLQMPTQQGGGTNPIDDEIARTLDMLDQNQPDRFDSVGTVIAKKHALRSGAERLNALQGMQGNRLKAQSEDRQFGANMGLAQQKLQSDYLNNQTSNQTELARAEMEQANNDRNYGLELQKINQPTFTPIYESGFDPQTQMETKKLSGGFNTKTGLPVLNSNSGNDKDQQDFMAAMSLAKDDKARLHLLQQRHPEYFSNGK